MIEDAGTYGIVVLAILIVICMYFAYRQYREPNLWQAGHLYLMYFWGAHDSFQIMNEIDPREYTVTAVYHDLVDLEKRGYIERIEEHDNVGEGRYGHAYQMTDKGEAKYLKLSKLYGLPVVQPEDDEAYRAEGAPNKMDPREIYRNERV